MLNQFSAHTLALAANNPTHQARVQAVSQYFQSLKHIVLAMAHDYKAYGKFYHKLPARDRFHAHAKVNSIAAEARADFVISPTTHELPVMVNLLRTCQTNLSETEVLLTESVSIFDLDGVYSNLMSVDRLTDQAWPIMGKIKATMGLYEQVIIPERHRAGDWGGETDQYKTRQLRQAQEWSDALPEICDGRFPPADGAAVRRVAMRTALAATAWAEEGPALQRRPRATGRRATMHNLSEAEAQFAIPSKHVVRGRRRSAAF